MKSKKINIGALLILIAFVSLVTISKAKRLLATDNEAIEIDDKLGNEIITGYYSLESNYNYYMYKIRESASFAENYNSFTIEKPNTNPLEIQCLLDSSSSIDQISSKFNSKVCQVFQSETSKIVNVVYDLSEFKKDSSKNLLIRIKGTQGDALNFYFRIQNSYTKSITDTLKIQNAFAYLCFYARTDSLLKLIGSSQYYYQGSAADSFYIYGVSKDGNTLLDTNSFAMITNQTMAFQYLSYDELAIFIGVPKQDKDSDNELTVFTQIENVDGDKYIYYKTDGVDTANQLFYHSECKKGQQHYIAVNYGFADQDYYVTVNTLQGANAVYIADSFTALNGFVGYSYNKVKGITKATSNDLHLHVYRLECAEENTSLVFNMKYNKNEKKKRLEIVPGSSDGGFIDFDGIINGLVVDYTDVDEVKVEVFLEGSEDAQKFNVRFEKKDHELMNGKKIYLKRTNEDDIFLNIGAPKALTAYVMVSGSVINFSSDESSMIFQDEETGISFTGLTRKYNANYGGAIPIKNKQGTARRVCYYFSEVTVFQKSSQNCFVVKTETKLVFSKLLIKEASDAEFQSDKYNYRMYIMLSEVTGGKLSFSPLEYITDLPQSTKITKQGNDYIYAEGTAPKNDASYFSRILSAQTVTDDSFFDIYLGNDQESSYADANLKIICVLGYEIAIPYVEHLFTEENNICKIVNAEEKNPRIVHVFADLSHYKDIKNNIVNLLIKVSTQKEVDVKFMIRSQSNVQTTLNIESANTFRIPGPDAFSVYDLSMSSLSKIASKQLLLYNNETDSIKIYGRNGNNFHFIDRGSAIVLKYKDFYYSYKSYPKFLVFLGKVGCPIERCVSQYNVNLVNDLYFYHSLPNEFTDSYHTTINIPDCQESTRYTVIFNYFKKPKEQTMYFSKQIKGGEIQYTRYAPKLDYNTFDKLPLKSMADLQEMDTIEQHTSVIQFKCKNDFFANFYYFAKTDYSSGVIVLQEGSVKEYVIPVGKVYKFSYVGIDEIRVENLFGDKTPKIAFEGKEVSLEKNLATLKRKSNDNNEFSIQNLSQEKDSIVRITTSINTKSFEKTSIPGLSKYKGAFIYEAPKNAASIKFVLVLLKRLRLLAEVKNEVRVCYNTAMVPLIDRNDVECFFATPDSNEFTYQVPTYLSKDIFYIALFSDESEPDAFDIKEVIPKYRDDSGEGLSSGWIVFIIIIVILVLLGIFIVVFLIISKRKRVSSGDIEGGKDLASMGV